MDDDLKWNEHIKSLTTKLSRANGLFFKIRKFVPRKILMLLYNALVGSYMRYGIIAWGSYSPNLLNTIQSIQNKILRTILFMPPSTPVLPLYTQLKVLNVGNVYIHESTKFIHSVHYQYSPASFSNFFQHSNHRYSTRLNQDTYFIPVRPQTELSKKSLKFSGVKKWNALPSSLKDIPESDKFIKSFIQHIFG